MSKTKVNSFVSYALQQITNENKNEFEFVQGKYYGGFKATLDGLNQIKNYCQKKENYVVNEKNESVGLTVTVDENSIIPSVVVCDGENSTTTIVVRKTKSCKNYTCSGVSEVPKFQAETSKEILKFRSYVDKKLKLDRDTQKFEFFLGADHDGVKAGPLALKHICDHYKWEGPFSVFIVDSATVKKVDCLDEVFFTKNQLVKVVIQRNYLQTGPKSTDFVFYKKTQPQPLSYPHGYEKTISSDGRCVSIVSPVTINYS